MFSSEAKLCMRGPMDRSTSDHFHSRFLNFVLYTTLDPT